MKFSHIKKLTDVCHKTVKFTSVTTPLDRLQVMFELAGFIPHPAVKAISRGATTGLILYKHYRKIKVKSR